MTSRPSPSLALAPEDADHEALVDAAAKCRACSLYARATHVVFGEGPVPAQLMLVGEQPGDQEDRSGRPFVGPAGNLLDELLAEADIPRGEVYVTNAVKHFKWEPRGKRRIHAKPNGTEVHACHGWLEREIGLVAPQVIVCLGATAAQALLGRDFRLTKSRGVLLDRAGKGGVLATYHPSALLRMRARDEEEYLRERDAVVRDLVTAASGIRVRPRGRRSTRTAHHAAH